MIITPEFHASILEGDTVVEFIIGIIQSPSSKHDSIRFRSTRTGLWLNDSSLPPRYIIAIYRVSRVVGGNR